MRMRGHHCRDVEYTEFGDRLNIFHTYNIWWIFLQSPGFMKHTRKLYRASTRVPPKTRVGTRMNKNKIEKKSTKKSVRPVEEGNNEIKINIKIQ